MVLTAVKQNNLNNIKIMSSKSDNMKSCRTKFIQIYLERYIDDIQYEAKKSNDINQTHKLTITRKVIMSHHAAISQ